jgi:hypothetical protein
MKRRRISTALLGAVTLMAQPFVGSPAAAAPPNADLKAMIEGRRWFMPQFRFNDSNAKDVPALFAQLASLPYVKDHAILDPMIDIFQLAKAGQYKTIPDSAWAPVDAMLAQARQAGFTRIMPTLSFKIDPKDPVLAQYCAQWETRGPDGQTQVIPAVGNGSCLPQYANADYQALAQNILAQALQHLERKFGDIMIAYEPVGGVGSEIDWSGTSDQHERVFGDVSPSMTARFQQHIARQYGGGGAFGRFLGANSKAVQGLASAAGVRPPSRFSQGADTDSGGNGGNGGAKVSRGDGGHFGAANGPRSVSGDGAFLGNMGRQYALARANVVQDFYSAIAAEVRQYAPGKLFSLRMGAIIEPSAVLRTTVFFQQYAQAIKPDLMVSDASTFNHLYEGPLVAATRFQEDSGGRAVPIPGRPAWVSFVDRFPTYAAKNIDYRQSATQQVTDCFEHNDFRVVGFFMNPGEMQQHPEYLAFLQSLTPQFMAPPAPFTPQRFVQMPLSWEIDQLSTVGYGQALLPQIKRQTSNFTVPTAIQLTQDVDQR